MTYSEMTIHELVVSLHGETDSEKKDTLLRVIEGKVAKQKAELRESANSADSGKKDAKRLDEAIHDFNKEGASKESREKAYKAAKRLMVSCANSQTLTKAHRDELRKMDLLLKISKDEIDGSLTKKRFSAVSENATDFLRSQLEACFEKKRGGQFVLGKVPMTLHKPSEKTGADWRMSYKGESGKRVYGFPVKEEMISILPKNTPDVFHRDVLAAMETLALSGPLPFTIKAIEAPKEA